MRTAPENVKEISGIIKLAACVTRTTGSSRPNELLLYADSRATACIFHVSCAFIVRPVKKSVEETVLRANRTQITANR